MDPSSSSLTKRKPSKIAGYTRIFLLTVVVLTSILGVLFIVLRFSNTAHQETAVATNPMPVVNEEAVRPTVSALSGDICHGMQEQNQMVKLSPEIEHDVIIDFVNEKLAIQQEVYEMIISITNEITEAKDLSDRDLESIAEQISTKTYPVTLTNMKDYIVLMATIGKDTYVLKRMNIMYFEGTNDRLATMFSSPYIVEILMTFTNGTGEWMVMEYVGPGIRDFHGDFTEEEIWLLIHNCLTGLDAIHKGGYYHKDLSDSNIVSVRNNEGKTVGFKIIDFGMSTVKYNSQMEPSELYYEIEGILGIVKDYLKHRVDMRPKGVGYMEVVNADTATYSGLGSIVFLKEDSILADFFMTAAGWVSKPATSITDLMKHQYVTGKNANLFGERLWTFMKRMPSESFGN